MVPHKECASCQPRQVGQGHERVESTKARIVASTSILGEIRDAVSALSERGVAGGIYAGTMLFGGVLSAQFTPVGQLGWLFVGCIVLAWVLSSVTYELLMPLLSALTKPFVVRGFKSVTGEEQDYRTIRLFRERVLASAADGYLAACGRTAFVQP